MAHVDTSRSASKAAVSAAPLIVHRDDTCVECWGCVRHCPANAIRIVGERSEIIEERCVKCGLCVTECGHASFSVRDDLTSVRKLLASDRPVVALLASEYIAAMHPMEPDEVESRLAAAGFAAFETTVLGEEMVATAYERLHARSDAHLPQLRSTCPVAVEWVRRFFPEFSGALAPIVPPYIAHARLVRALYPQDVSIVYVSPCWARKDDVFDSQLASDVDAVIGFDELKRLLKETPSEVPSEPLPRRPQAPKQISVTDGFPRRTLTERDMTDPEVAVVRGLEDIDRLLSAIARGETAPAVIDMLCCEGCLDGPCVGHGLSVFVKRTIDSSERRRQPSAAVDSRTFLAALPRVELHRTFTPQPARLKRPSDAELDEVLAEGEFSSRAETIDCGACGFETCVGHATAIWEGNSIWDRCFPLQKRRLVREREQLAEAAVIDILTGLTNRRAFDRRLAEEVARSSRYGSPLSLVMMDLDGFKSVNDEHGHSAGDALLRAVGVLLNSDLRTADVAVRFGGDEFALILPNTGKTDAWAVAEKIRLSLGQLAVHTESGHCITTSASMGIASVSEDVAHPNDLLDSADSALYRAKRAGRNRVELAAG